MAPRATKQSPKPKIAELERWFVQNVPAEQSENRGPLRVWGLPVGEPNRKLWRSSSIVKRISSTTLETRFHTRVVLRGRIDSVAAASNKASMTQEAIEAFTHGFPPTWRTIAANAFTTIPRVTRDTLPELPIPAPAAAPVPPAPVRASSKNANAKKQPSAATKPNTKTRTKKNSKNGKSRISTTRKRVRPAQSVLKTVPIENFYPIPKRSRRATEPPQSHRKAPPPEMGRKSAGNTDTVARQSQTPARRANGRSVKFDDVNRTEENSSHSKRKSKRKYSVIDTLVNDPVDMEVSIASPEPTPLVVDSDDDDFVTPLHGDRNANDKSKNAKSKHDDDDDDDEFHTPPMEQSAHPIRTKSPAKKSESPRRSPKKPAAAEKKKPPVRGESTDTDEKLRDSADRLIMMMNVQHSKKPRPIMETPSPRRAAEMDDDDMETEEDEEVSDVNEIPRSALAVRDAILRKVAPLKLNVTDFESLSKSPKEKGKTTSSIDRNTSAEASADIRVIQESVALPQADEAEQSSGTAKANKKMKADAERWSFDKLLKAREDQVKNGAPAFPSPVKRKVIPVESFFTPEVQMPTPIYPSTRTKSRTKSTKRTSAPPPVSKKTKQKKSVLVSKNKSTTAAAAKTKSTTAAATKTKNATAATRKSKKATAVAPVKKNTTQPKKRGADAGAGPSKNPPTKKRKISFKDQFSEIEDEPQKQRGGRRAARMAQASLASTPKTTPANPSGPRTRGVFWTGEQIKAFDRMRGELVEMASSANYWVRVAAGVEGRSAQECQERWWDTFETPEKKKNPNINSKAKKKTTGKSTPELALKYAQDGVTKAHTKTAKFASNMRRIVDANARDVVASQEQVYEPPKVAGYSPTTPVGMFPSDSSSLATPGTEARQRRKEMEPPKFDTPEPFARTNGTGAENSVADRIVAQFKKRFGSVLNATATEGSPGAEKKKTNRPEMEDALREINTKEKKYKDDNSENGDDEDERESEEDGVDTLI